jgi:hypothetical protein
LLMGCPSPPQFEPIKRADAYRRGRPHPLQTPWPS